MATSSSSVLWAPLSASSFPSVQHQQQFVQLRKWLDKHAHRQLVRASRTLLAALACSTDKGCTPSSCRLHRGAVVARLTCDTPAPTDPDTEIVLEWNSLPELCRLQRLKVLQAAISYDRSKEILFLILIPSSLLPLLMVPTMIPEVGIFGIGTLSIASLAVSFARQCFREIQPQIPHSLAHIDPETLPVDPAAAEPPPSSASVTGLGDHASLAVIMVHRESEDSEGAAALTQARLYLQATINKFWCTVGGMGPRLTARVRKLRCKERLMCNGISCDNCRGAMVFNCTALEGPSGQSWKYRWNGEELDSSAPKQYIRGDWLTVTELHTKLGTTDTQLLTTAVTHDRKTSYLLALHIPAALVQPSHEGVPPEGLLLWKLMSHTDTAAQNLPALNLPVTIPTASSNLAGSQGETSNRSQPASVSPRVDVPQLEASGSAAGGRLSQPGASGDPALSADVAAGSTEAASAAAGVGGQPPAASGALSGSHNGAGIETGQGEQNAAAPLDQDLTPQPGEQAVARPRQCCMHGCPVVEEGTTGVLLMSCACHQVQYCTPQHQRVHWKLTHRQACPVAALPRAKPSTLASLEDGAPPAMAEA